VDDWREIPVEFSLGPNYPNPFNPTTSFVVGLPQSAPLSVGVYNMVGQKVRTLIDEVRPGGYFTVQWDGTTDDHQVAGSGVYFVRMASQSFSAVRKIVMLR
jgi:flagellar hook assembly protein FlgD